MSYQYSEKAIKTRMSPVGDRRMKEEVGDIEVLSNLNLVFSLSTFVLPSMKVIGSMIGFLDLVACISVCTITYYFNIRLFSIDRKFNLSRLLLNSNYVFRLEFFDLSRDIACSYLEISINRPK